MPGRAGTLTKYGEARIKGLIKFDLGGGYRLITYKQERTLYLLYVGTHDACHRWIENNRELTVEQIQERCTVIPVAGVALDTPMDEEQDDLAEEMDFDPLASVSERDLRIIFCGLVAADS